MSGALRAAGHVGAGPYPVGKEHHALFTDLDRRMLQRAHKSDVQDPGQKSLAEIQALTADERLVYDQRRKQWMEAMPAVSTTPASAALDTLKRHCAASAGDEDAQQDVLAVWGEPGVGKSKLSRQLAAFEIERLARLDFLLGHGNARPFDRTTPRPSTQHVVHFEFKGAMSRIDFEREVCHQLGQLVKRGDWASSLTRALRTCETRFLILDEIQFINFGGATGRQIHHSIKNITNSGTNVIIFGNDIQSFAHLPWQTTAASMTGTAPRSLQTRSCPGAATSDDSSQCVASRRPTPLWDRARDRSAFPASVRGTEPSARQPELTLPWPQRPVAALSCRCPSGRKPCVHRR